MKPGSKVVILPLPLSDRSGITGIPVDDGETVYTVKDIRPGIVVNSLAVYLEETTIVWRGLELGISLEYVREIQPMSGLTVDALLEELSKKELVNT